MFAEHAWRCNETTDEIWMNFSDDVFRGEFHALHRSQAATSCLRLSSSGSGNFVHFYGLPKALLEFNVRGLFSGFFWPKATRGRSASQKAEIHDLSGSLSAFIIKNEIAFILTPETTLYAAVESRNILSDLYCTIFHHLCRRFTIRSGKWISFIDSIPEKSIVKVKFYWWTSATWTAIITNAVSPFMKRSSNFRGNSFRIFYLSRVAGWKIAATRKSQRDAPTHIRGSAWKRESRSRRW